jgi:hypothetical protein
MQMISESGVFIFPSVWYQALGYTALEALSAVGSSEIQLDGIIERRTSASLGFERSRGDRTGDPSVVEAVGQVMPTSGSSHASPCSSVPSYSFVTKYMRVVGSEARNP